MKSAFKLPEGHQAGNQVNVVRTVPGGADDDQKSTERCPVQPQKSGRLQPLHTDSR